MVRGCEGCCEGAVGGVKGGGGGEGEVAVCGKDVYVDGLRCADGSGKGYASTRAYCRSLGVEGCCRRWIVG